MTDEAAILADGPAVEYRDVPGFPGYRVGGDGSVWTCRERYYPTGDGRRGVRYRPGSKWASLTARPIGDYGYLDVTLYRDGRPYHRLVHRLVLEAFVGPCPDGMEARHFPDPSPSNNAVGNLQWDTKVNNQADRVTHGTDSRGENHGNHRLTAVGIVEIFDLWANGLGYPQIAEAVGTHRSNVRRIILGEAWRHIPRPSTVRLPEAAQSWSSGHSDPAGDLRRAMERITEETIGLPPPGGF